MDKEIKIEEIFAKPSLKEWIAKINKDLKGVKTADELQYIVEKGMEISAVQPYVSMDNKSIIRNSNKRVACHIDTTEADCNTKIKELLNVGVNTLILDASSTVDYDKLLDGVILDFIEIVVYPIDDLAEGKLLAYLQSKEADFSKIYSPSTKRNLMHISFAGSIVDQLVQLLMKVYENEAGEEFALVLDAQRDFISEVSKIRAAHILLANLSKALGKEIKYSLLSHTKPPETGVHELIQSTYMGLAAIIGEADGIVCSALDPKYRLNVVHTFNLMTMEVYLGEVNDPAAGSNLIEEMTERICHDSWASFKKQAGQ